MRRSVFSNAGAALIVAVSLLGAKAEAAVIEFADIGGYSTFQDTTTGLVWLDFDNFFDLTHNQMAALATAAGFTVATETEVTQLTSTLPLDNTGTLWASYAAVMGSAPNRPLIWGSYGPVSGINSVGWAFAFDNDFVWSLVNDITGADFVPNGGSQFADMNIWAYQTAQQPVPEPATLLLLGTGLGAVAARRRLRKRA